jgi:hypothetical protein
VGESAFRPRWCDSVGSLAGISHCGSEDALCDQALPATGRGQSLGPLRQLKLNQARPRVATLTVSFKEAWDAASSSSCQRGPAAAGQAPSLGSPRRAPHARPGPNLAVAGRGRGRLPGRLGAATGRPGSELLVARGLVCRSLRRGGRPAHLDQPGRGAFTAGASGPRAQTASEQRVRRVVRICASGADKNRHIQLRTPGTTLESGKLRSRAEPRAIGSLWIVHTG